MKMAFVKKTNNMWGFSLAESLVAIIILLLVSSIVAAGIPAAVAAYDKAVTGANAQALLSTAVTALRDELGTARDIEVLENKRVQYYSADTMSVSEMYLSSDATRTGEIILKEYIPYEISGETASISASERRLVTPSAATNHLYVTFESISRVPDKDIISITGLKVLQEGHNNPIVSLETLYIHIITGLDS